LAAATLAHLIAPFSSISVRGRAYQQSWLQPPFGRRLGALESAPAPPDIDQRPTLILKML